MGKKFLLTILCIVFASAAFAQVTVQPTSPEDNATINGYLTAIRGTTFYNKIVDKIKTADYAKDFFKEHMEVVRISSPSRYEVYRGMEMAARFKAAGFADENIVFSKDGKMPGAAIQLIDGKPVWNACAIVPGVTGVDASKGIYSRPKVLIEGHIDTVNPASIDISDTSKIPTAAYDTIRIAPISKPMVNTPAELAAITDTLKFGPDGKIMEDENFAKAYQRFTDYDDAVAKGAYRIFIPGYSDAMDNTMSVYQMAKLFKESGVKPVYDIWFCMTAGEEGRGNLAGMKQLFGYNQQAEATDNALKGKNTLNFVANLSIDGGDMEIHYLGSYRYEVNYKSTDGKANAAMATARAMNLIADVKSPSEEDNNKPKTTYTVGMSYPVDKDGNISTTPIDGAKSTSFEIDMRSPVPDVLNEIKAKLYPKFAEGAALESKYGIKQDIKWFGDRPAHKRDFELMAKDPLVFVAWQTHQKYIGALNLPQYPDASSSLNDNVPAAIGVPSVNMNLGSAADGGNGHGFNEYGIPGSQDDMVKNMQRVMEVLLTMSGVHNDAGDTVLVKPAYGPVGARHVAPTDVWE